jgi:RNA polymerase sigma factor (sigma-70 family)
MPRTPAHLQRRNALIHRFLPLADALARRHHRRYGDLLERDDLIQVARLSLVQAASRITSEATAPAYLKRCVTGALAHHLRDRSRLVRLPARQQHGVPWGHLSLDAPITGGGSPSLVDQLPAPQTSPAAAEPQLISQLLGLLQPPQAAAIQLTILDGLSLRQAAQTLGISAMTVSRHRRQGLDHLHYALSAEGACAA